MEKTYTLIWHITSKNLSSREAGKTNCVSLSCEETLDKADRYSMISPCENGTRAESHTKKTSRLLSPHFSAQLDHRKLYLSLLGSLLQVITGWKYILSLHWAYLAAQGGGAVLQVCGLKENNSTKLDKRKDDWGSYSKNIAIKSLITDKRQGTNTRLAVNRELRQQRKEWQHNVTWK